MAPRAHLIFDSTTGVSECLLHGEPAGFVARGPALVRAAHAPANGGARGTVLRGLRLLRAADILKFSRPIYLGILINKVDQLGNLAVIPLCLIQGGG